jgi:hypothetical protein
VNGVSESSNYFEKHRNAADSKETGIVLSEQGVHPYRR